MSSVNKVILLGNVGQDPEIKATQNGTQVASISIACGESWIDAAGQKQERTEWVKCILWDKKAEIVGKYINKGSKLYIEGKLKTRIWDDQQGVKHYATEVIVDQLVLCGGANPQNNAQQPQDGPYYEPVPNTQRQPQQRAAAPQNKPPYGQQAAKPQGGYQQRPTQQQPTRAPVQDFSDDDVPF